MRNLTTPCIGTCKIDADKEVCIGCHRTINEIGIWSRLEMSERMDIMKRIQKDNSKSYCPECGIPNKCALEQGKSINACWCFSETFESVEDKKHTSCLCKRCLTNQQTDGEPLCNHPK